MAPSKINHGAQLAAAEDRDIGILHVMRGHRSLGTTSRVSLADGLERAFASYQKIESGEPMQRVVRLLMAVG